MKLTGALKGAPTLL